MALCQPERFARAEVHAAERSAQRHGRANRRLRALLAAAAVLLVSALVAGLVAARQAGTARESAEVADAQRAGARALASQNLAESYRVAANELADILGEARSHPDTLTDEEWGRFVRDGEQSISREHMLWLARREPGLAPDDK